MLRDGDLAKAILAPILVGGSHFMDHGHFYRTGQHKEGDVRDAAVEAGQHHAEQVAALRGQPCKGLQSPKMMRLTILGVEVDPLSIDELNACIARAIACGERRIIANQNLHAVYLYHRDAKMRAFFSRAQVTHIDGMPLIVWARILGYSIGRKQRVSYLDWVNPLMGVAEREGWRVFYLGGRPGIAARAAESLKRRYPGLVIETRHGFFSQDENDSVIGQIASFRPQILMVGMGMPRQEHWVMDNLDRIEANAILTAGACFDYLAGVIPTPPRWMGPLGIEWLFRLISEPRRLARRYLVEPWGLLPLLANDILMIRYHRRNAAEWSKGPHRLASPG